MPSPLAPDSPPGTAAPERSPVSAAPVSVAPRPLGTVEGAALVVASMVGTGVFTTTGVLLRSLGSPVLVLAVWVTAGLLALCGAAVYAELGTMMPRAGGEYIYLSRAYHPAIGFLSGWIGLLVGFAAPAAAAALAFGRYVHAVAPALPQKPLALALIAALTVAHMTDVKFGGRLQAGLTGLVVLLILVFITGAVVSGRGDWANLSAAAGAGAGSSPVVGAGALALGLVYVSYAYFGWNAAAYVAGEFRDPVRALPRALVAGTALVTALYVGLNLVFLWAAPPAALSGQVEVAHVAARALFGPRGASLLSTLVALALAGSVSAFMMSGPRFAVAMARDGLFFRALGRTGARGAPTAAVALQGGLALVAAATATFDPILVYVGFTLTVSCGATVVAAFVLRWREPRAERPHHALGWPVSGLLFVASAIFMTAFAIHDRPYESAAGLLTLAAGGLAYRVWRRA
jgi:APA family basic amino acid/polyamine antiporter